MMRVIVVSNKWAAVRDEDVARSGGNELTVSFRQPIGELEKRSTTMTIAPTKTELQTALELFESCLETPLVPGEIVSWSESLHNACCHALPAWQQEMQNEHPQQFKQIKREDPEMGTRIENMQKEDAEISCQFDALCQDVANFQTRAEVMEKDEARFKPAMEELVSNGLKLVIRVRTQQQALKTWLLEAFDRDRGAGD